MARQNLREILFSGDQAKVSAMTDKQSTTDRKWASGSRNIKIFFLNKIKYFYSFSVLIVWASHQAAFDFRV